MKSSSFPTYESAELKGIMALLRRASPGRQEDRALVEKTLLGIIHAVGLAHDGSEEALIWEELSAKDASHRDLRDGFGRLAQAEDPLELARRESDLGAGLNAQIRSRWLARWRRQRRKAEPSLDTVVWEMLSSSEQVEIRAMAKKLADYYGSLVRRGRRQKMHLDAALWLLADHYLDWTGQTIAPHDLPYSVNSLFVRFAAAALGPVGHYFEVSPEALSGRWERLVSDVRKEAKADPASID
jgi:hypothetical protein